MKTRLILATLLTMAVAVPAVATPASKPGQAAPNPRAGAAISAQCAMCHGSNGISVAANIPNLAGQHYPYLLHQLKSFKSGTIENPLMNQMAGALSKQQMQDLAAYFASIPIKVGTSPIPPTVTAGG